MRVEARWVANRPAAPGLFQRELQTIVAAAASSPTLRTLSAGGDELPDVRRVFMSRTRYYVYYRVTADVLEVLAIWQTARGEGAGLR